MSRTVWTYYITRNSIGGELSGNVDLWCVKPLRTKHSYRVTWVCTDHRDPGHMGEYTIVDMQKFLRVVPDSDLQLIKCEQYATEEKKK